MANGAVHDSQRSAAVAYAAGLATAPLKAIVRYVTVTVPPLLRCRRSGGDQGIVVADVAALHGQYTAEVVVDTAAIAPALFELTVEFVRLAYRR